LNFAGEVGQFIDGEDATIGARQQAVVNRHLAAQFVPAARGLDGIDVANQVGDGYIGRGQLFNVAVFLREIRDGSGIAELRDFVPAAAADRRIGIVVNLAARDVRSLRVEQRGKGAQNAALGLAAKSQQNKVMPRKDRIDNLRHNGIVIANNSEEDWSDLAKFRHQVIAQLVLHAAASQLGFGERTVAELAERPRKTHDRKTPRENSFWPRLYARAKDYPACPLPPALRRTCMVRRMLGKIVSKNEMIARRRSPSDFIPSNVCLKSRSRGSEPARWNESCPSAISEDLSGSAPASVMISPCSFVACAFSSFDASSSSSCK